MKIIYILITFLIPSLLFSQNINLYNINADNFPLIEADFFITDSDGNQITNVGKDDFLITEKQREKIINDVFCVTDSSIRNISTVLTLDLSSSMRGAKFEWIKEASSAWISQMDSSREETAITTFDDEALLYSDFNINKESLLEILETLELRDGTNFRTAFLDPYAGALDVARRADYQPIIVFLTDGVGTTDFNVAEVVSLAKSMNAIVYAISLEITLPDEIKEVTDATGGLYFEEVDNRDKLVEVYNTIRKIALRTAPCKISWFTDGCLLGKEAKIEYTPQKISKQFSFDNPGFKPPQFEFIDGEFATFDCKVPNIYKMRLRALNSSIEVTSIEKVSGVNACNQFEATIINKELPFVLEKDSVMEIEINYLGQNAEYNFCEFTINSSTCLNVEFYAVSNCLNSPPKNVILNVEYPNGGEIIKSGSKQEIKWSGSQKDKNKIIEYSTNSGASWNLVTSGKLDKTVLWNTPNVESDKCLVRVQQMSEMAGRKLYSLNIDSVNVNKVSWNNAGNVFAVLSDNGKIYLVNSVVGEIANVFDLGNSGDGDINFLPDGVRLLYSSANGTELINLISQEVTPISGFGGEIEFSFNSDIGLIYNNFELRILDLRTLTFINQFNLPPGASEITDGAISKSSNKIVVSTSTNNKPDSLYILTKLDKWANYTINTIIDDVFNYSYQFVEWSHDENYIISTSRIGDEKWLEIWDVSTGIKIDKLFAPTFSEIRDLSTSYYDNYVVMVDRSLNVIVWEWDLNDDNIFSKKYDLKSETSVNNDIEWSKDGTRFAVGQKGLKNDSLLTVYSVKSYPEVLDISDSTFTLVRNPILVNDINMGNVLVNSTKDSTISSLITYSYPFELEMDSISISGLDAFNFDISNSPNLPAILSNISQPDFQFEFKPTRQGLHTAKATLHTKYGSSEFELAGNGVKPLLGKTDLSFGEVNVDDEKIMTQKVLINNGTSDLKIKSIELINPSKEQFKLYDNTVEVLEISDILLSPNEEYELQTSFLPNDDLIFNSRIEVEYFNDINVLDTVYIKLDGRGIKPQLVYYEYNFGIVQCDEFIEDSITIYNNGSGELIIREIDLNKINFEFLDNTLNSLSILENDSAKIGIRFRPIDFGIIKDSIIFISNSHKDSVKVMYLNGRRLNTSFQIIGDTDFIGIDENSVVNEDFEILNDGKTNLVWNTPIVSGDGSIVINSVNPNPTLPGDVSKVSITINSGDKGEVYKYKFSPEPLCADSIEVNAEVKSTSPTLYFDVEDSYRIVCEDEFNVKIPINNIGEANLVIDSLKLSSDNSSFEINSNSFTLMPNQSDTIDISFRNGVPNEYKIILLVYSNDSKSESGVTSIPITIIKETLDYEIVESVVTFDYLNNNVPGTKSVRLVNKGTIPIRWDLNLSPDYKVLSISPPIADSGDTSIVRFIYIGNKEIFATDEFVVIDSCGNEKKIDINILGKGTETINISVGDEFRNIGERFKLKLQFVSSKNFVNNEVLRGNIKFNRTLMETYNSNSNTNSGNRIVPFEIENLSEDFEIEFDMIALWGNDSCTSITVNNLEMENSNVNISYTVDQGELCIIDLCYADGARLLKSNMQDENNIEITSNNNQIKLKVKSIEQSDLEVSLYDFYGREMKKEIFSYSKDNNYLVNIGNLNSGSYFVKVKTYSQIFNEKILIIK